MTSTGEEARFYMNLLRTNLLGPKYDLYKIPGPPGYPLMGHIPLLARPDYHKAALEWANKYGGICRFSLFGQHVVLVSDPALVAQILGRGPQSLPTKSIGYSFFDLATNDKGRRSFFTTRDEGHWALVRKGTAAAFSSANIRRYFLVALKHSQELAGQLRLAASRSRGGVVEVQEQVEMMLLDVFLEGLFEMDLRRVNSEEVGAALNLVLEEANERIKMPLRAAYLPLLHPRVWRAQRLLAGLYGRMYDDVRARGVPPEDDTLLWACLARLQDPKTGRPLTREQLVPEIGAFMLAGFDTSSHTISWCLFTIATHPEVQMRIKAELAAAGLLHAGTTNCTTPRQLVYEDLGRLTYLNAVIDETMRLYPVGATGSVRETIRPSRVGAYVLPPGVAVWPMIYATHNTAGNWEQPERFWPERWLEGRDVAYAPALAITAPRAEVDKTAPAAAGPGARAAPPAKAKPPAAGVTASRTSSLSTMLSAWRASSGHAPTPRPAMAGAPECAGRGSGGDCADGSDAAAASGEAGLGTSAASHEVCTEHKGHGGSDAGLDSAAEHAAAPAGEPPADAEGPEGAVSADTAGHAAAKEAHGVMGALPATTGQAGAAPSSGDSSSGGERGAKRFIPFSDGLKSCMGKALGLMEVRTALVVMLSRFWVELAPSMGRPEAVARNQTIALTLKMASGLRLVCAPHRSGAAAPGAAAKQRPPSN